MAGILDCGNEDETALKANTFNNDSNVKKDTENETPYVSTEDSPYNRVMFTLKDLLLNFCGLFQFSRKVFCSFFIFKTFCG